MSYSPKEQIRDERYPEKGCMPSKEETSKIPESQNMPSITVPKEGSERDNNRGDAQRWSSTRKRTTITLVSALTFLASMAATIFAPGVPALMKEIKSKNEELSAFVVSVYIVGFGIGPMLLAPLSEIYGRAILLHCSNIGLLIFSIACAVSPSLGVFVFFRLMMGIAGCVPLTIGGGVIADIVPIEERGPVIGPVIGSYLAQEAGWRWIFWLLAISSGVLSLLTVTFFRETYAPVIVKRQCKSSINARTESTVPSRQPSSPPTQVFLRAILRPTKLMFLSPVAAILALLISVYYSYLYFLFTTFTPVFEEKYKFSTGAARLSFLEIGIGLVLGVFSVGAFAERYTKRKAMAFGNSIKPEDRLPPLLLGAIFIRAGLILYGWTAYFRVHWIVPMLGTLLVGYGAALAFLPVQMYLVDAFQLYAASAIATNTIMRNIIGATLPLAGGKLYGALGLGWGNTLLGLICVAVIPVPVLLMRFGERLRTDPRFQVNLD